ncbi:CMGC SRPK kinase [Fusarium agapanthi]|uniref:non-specific serine/threonine protein kinase n=1 Tax=Fusarium agapanthi TaxID=1803897 RepID=A0A9P5E359_9HYPO|nr:CMGC SRPK kinase [Fusarium agapanthi]
MPAQTYSCNVDAEPLHRYRPGGYHPLALGDALKNGRYKILHKLGWGSYSTTWAAKDQKDDRYVAVKITISEVEESGELKILRALSTLPIHHPGSSHVNQLLDYFTLVGPNGSHDCLVLELVGPNVADIVELHCKDDRLPSKLAKVFAKQALQGLDFLAVNDIGHGDLHTRNLALVVSDLNFLNEEDFIARLGKPKTGPVSRSDGGPLAHSVPTQIIQPAFFRRRDIMLSCPSIKIIDFGEAFFSDNAPSTLHTPLPVRAPEVVFGDQLDRRVDLWSAGCLIFELITGQPPFDVVMLTPSVLVEQMIELTSDELPSRWQAKWHAMQEDVPQKNGGFTLQKWLEETYFGNNKQAEFTTEEIARVAQAIAGMLKLEPSLRATPSEILAQDWFQ